MAFTGILAEVGETETEIDCGEVTVTVAEADLVRSVAEVAVSETDGLVGTVAGAV